MANMNDLFPSKLLKAYDLKGTEPVVTIARVEREAMGRTRELCPVVYFRGKAKGLKLNKTMATAISAIANSGRTEDWVGTQVRLYSTTADFGGEPFAVIRIKAAIASTPPAPVAPPPPPAPIAMDDNDIPF